MGEVIRKGAAADAIFSDARTTATNAAAQGGKWQTLATERLGAYLTVAASVEQKLAAANDALAPLAAALDVVDEGADKLLGRVADDIWNGVGRPGSDPFLTVLLPGGVAYYTAGPDAEQPARMDLFAELLEAGLHPKLAAPTATAFATEIRASAVSYRAALAAYEPVKARVEHYGRIATALARTTQMALANLKRAYKAEGFGEAEIHRVIPDRPTSAGGDPSGGGGPKPPG